MSPSPVMHFRKTVYFPFLNHLVYPIICNTRIKKMMTSFFKIDMAFKLASLYHNRQYTILTVPKNDIKFEKKYDMIILTAKLCNIGLF